MAAIFRMTVSIFLGFCVVGGAVYFVLKTDKIPVLNKRQVDTGQSKSADDALSGRRDISHAVVGESVPVGSVVKCIEDGKVTYSNAGCKDGVAAKAVEMHHAAGVVGPSREVVDATVARMFAERASEKQRLEAVVTRPRSMEYSGQIRIDQCKRLNDRNDAIDRESNQVLTAWVQGQLRDEKSQNIKRQFDLHCQG